MTTQLTDGHDPDDAEPIRLPLELGNDSQPQRAAIVYSSPVPGLAELNAWEVRYRARYQAQHRARNEALRRLTNDDPSADEWAHPSLIEGRVDTVMHTLEGELQGALELVTDDHFGIAQARGDGFVARRDNKVAAACPIDPTLYDQFMAWHAGWVQADPNLKLPRTRGYTPP